MSHRLIDRSPFARRVRWLLLPSLLAAVASAGCADKAKKNQNSCNPEDKGFKTIRVLVQGSDQLNPNAEGEALSVVFRLYQLKSDTATELVDFEQVWKEGGEAAFGEEFIAEEEETVYPQRPALIELKPEEDARHVVAVALFNEPVGQDWFEVWDMPRYHGHSVCEAEGKGEPWPDPCFYVYLDRFQVSGGHKPPPGFNLELAQAACPGPPRKTPPPPPEDKKKKKKKKSLKDRLKKAQDAEVPETPETPETPSVPETPQAPSVPETPSAPEAPAAPEIPGT